MGRHAKTIEVPAHDREVLESRLRATTTPRGLATRARIVLLSSEGLGGEAIAGRLGLAPTTVFKWRSRYEAQGLAGLEDAERPGRPRAISPEKAKQILDETIHTIPRGATHWSLRLMAKRAGVTVHQVREVWLAAGLKPHRIRTFKISNDPAFAEKVSDVVGLYLNPPDNAVVLSVDEKTQIQALDRTQPMLPLDAGKTERRTHDYRRNGVLSLYAAFDIATGLVRGRVTKRHRAREFLDFLRQIDRSTPADLAIHLILDNSSTHRTKAVQEWLAEHPRFHLHFTPTSASWLNAVEGWFGQLERRAIHRGTFCSVVALRKAIHEYIELHNDVLASPFRWTKSAEVIIASVDEIRSRTSQTAH